MKSYISFFRNMVNFHGRATRSEFFTLFITISIVLSGLSWIFPSLNSTLYEAIAYILLFIPSLSLTIRRFNDARISPYFAVILFTLPIIVWGISVGVSNDIVKDVINDVGQFGCLLGILIIALIPSKDIKANSLH